MTPAEARQIDKQEFEAECRAVRERALRHANQRRQEQKAVIDKSISREPITPKRRSFVKPTSRKLYTLNGEAKTATEWAQIAGVSYGTFMQRLSSGIALERAVTMPFGKCPRQGQIHNVNGEKKTLTEWAGHLGINYNALYARIRKHGSLEAVIARHRSRAAHGNARTYTFNGETKTIVEWSMTIGVNVRTLRSRLQQGWSIERTLIVSAQTKATSKPGVSRDFAPSEGTGAGRPLQAMPNITSTTKAENE